jgi:hypothetical protein
MHKQRKTAWNNSDGNGAHRKENDKRQRGHYSMCEPNSSGDCQIEASELRERTEAAIAVVGAAEHTS